jgi:hypothetical protein
MFNRYRTAASMMGHNEAVKKAKLVKSRLIAAAGTDGARQSRIRLQQNREDRSAANKNGGRFQLIDYQFIDYQLHCINPLVYPSKEQIEPTGWTSIPERNKKPLGRTGNHPPGLLNHPPYPFFIIKKNNAIDFVANQSIA